MRQRVLIGGWERCVHIVHEDERIIERAKNAAEIGAGDREHRAGLAELGAGRVQIDAGKHQIGRLCLARVLASLLQGQIADLDSRLKEFQLLAPIDRRVVRPHHRDRNSNLLVGDLPLDSARGGGGGGAAMLALPAQFQLQRDVMLLINAVRDPRVGRPGGASSRSRCKRG